MIMQRNDGPRGRSANHPWNHPETRLNSTEAPSEARNQSLTVKVSRTELRAIKARARGTSVSEFIRNNLPADIFNPPEQEA